MTNLIPIFQTEGQLPRFLGGLIHHNTECFDDPRLGVRLSYGIPLTPGSVLKADLYLYDFVSIASHAPRQRHRKPWPRLR